MLYKLWNPHELRNGHCQTFFKSYDIKSFIKINWIIGNFKALAFYLNSNHKFFIYDFVSISQVTV